MTLQVCISTRIIYIADWFKAIRAMVCLALIASVVTVALAIVYTFFHTVNKNVVLRLFIAASWLSGNGMGVVLRVSFTNMNAYMSVCECACFVYHAT